MRDERKKRFSNFLIFNILIFQIMGKKIRMKWKKLNIVLKDQDDFSVDKTVNLDNQHPFMKVGL